jgi:hypothetical protein
MNRIDKVIVFRALTREHLEKILDIELARVQQRIINATDGRNSCLVAPGRRGTSCCAKGRTSSSGRAT